MLPADPIGARPLRAVEPVSPADRSGDPKQEVFSRLTQISLGKTFQAEVLSRLNDGSYLVKIDNATLRAALPRNAQAGDLLPLKFVGTHPRPTFLLLDQSDAAPTSLSVTGKLLGAILQAAEKHDGRAIVSGKIAILPSASTDVLEIASSLKRAAASSGIFYESHLQQWADGTKGLGDLLKEPQAGFRSNFAQGAMQAQQTAAASTALVDIISDQQEAAKMLPAGMNGLHSASQLSQEAMQLIHQQLQTLEQHKFSWQGELWPGQHLEWEVGEEEAHETEGGETTPAWTSTVRFSLPTLGTVSATIRLEGQHVQMQLRTTTDEAAARLREHGGDLANAMELAGSPLSGFMVKQHEQA
jgi:hypothetical protein